MRVDSPAAAHVTSEDLAAYIDRHLDAASSARLEGHLADCADCRADLIDVQGIVEWTRTSNARRHVGRSMRAHPWLVAASIMTIASLSMLQRFVRSGDQRPIRATSTAVASVAVLTPRAAGVDAASVVFAWRPVEGASTYRLTVTDSSGTLVLTRVTGDTIVALPPGAPLHRGSSYLWYVDCLTTTGRTLSSGIRSFSTSR